MAHFAKLNENNIVLEVLVIEQEVVDSGLFGDPAIFVQSSYNTRGGVHYNTETGEPSADQTKALRKNYAGVGYTYDVERDAFIPPQPYASWVLNENMCLWEAPEPYSDDGLFYQWNEETTSWVLVE